MYSSPRATGWVDVAAQVGTTGTYSLTTLEQGSKGSFLRTGVAHIVSSKGALTLMLHADAGLGMQNTSSMVPGMGGGGVLVWDLGHVSKKLDGFQGLVVLRINSIKGQSVAPVYEFGFGRSF